MILNSLEISYVYIIYFFPPFSYAKSNCKLILRNFIKYIYKDSSRIVTIIIVFFNGSSGSSSSSSIDIISNMVIVMW